MNRGQDLDNLSIYQLRELARNLGVNHPTTLTKAALIEEMTAIMSGKKTPYKPAIRHGRPPKNVAQIGNVISIAPFESDFDEPTQAQAQFQDEDVEVNQSTLKFNTPSEPYKFRTEGYLEILASGAALLQSKDYKQTANRCLVSAELIERYRLKYGDFIECEAAKYMEGQPYLVSDILAVNGVNIENYEIARTDFKVLPSLGLSKVLAFKASEQPICLAIEKYPIYAGSSVAIAASSPQVISQQLVDIADGLLTAFGCKVIYLNVAKRRISPLIYNEKVICFTLDFDSSFKEQQKLALLAIHYAQNCAAMGEKVVIVADSLNSLASCMVSADNDLPLTKLLMGCAKNTAYGSITVITGFVKPSDTQVGKTIGNLYNDNVDILLQMAANGVEVDTQHCRYSLLESIPPEDAEKIKHNLEK